MIDLRCFNPLNAELNPICHFLAFLGAHHVLHVSRIRVQLRLLMQLQSSKRRDSSYLSSPFLHAIDLVQHRNLADSSSSSSSSYTSSSPPLPPPPPPSSSSSSSIGTTAYCGLWPVEQCPSI